MVKLKGIFNLISFSMKFALWLIRWILYSTVLWRQFSTVVSFSSGHHSNQPRWTGHPWINIAQNKKKLIKMGNNHFFVVTNNLLYFLSYHSYSKGTFESNLVLIHRVYCCSWDGCFTIRKKNRGHCDFFPFNRNLKVNSQWEIHINRAQEILAWFCLLSEGSKCSK